MLRGVRDAVHRGDRHGGEGVRPGCHPVVVHGPVRDHGRGDLVRAEVLWGDRRMALYAAVRGTGEILCRPMPVQRAGRGTLPALARGRVSLQERIWIWK